MLIRSQDGLTVVRTNSVWSQLSADKEKHYIFAATEFDPEGILLGEYDHVEKAKAMMARVLYTAELGEAVDLCPAKDAGDDPAALIDLTLEALKVAAKRFGIPKHIYVEMASACSGGRPGPNPHKCPKCFTTMEEGTDGKYCPTCGVTE